MHCRLHFEKSMSLELYPDNADRPRLEDAALAFPNRSDFRLAVLGFECRGQKFAAEFGATGGRVFDVVIKPNPRAVLSSSDITVKRFTSVGDPMEPAPSSSGV